MIRQLGSHNGKHVFFGWDRHLSDEVELYASEIASFGELHSVAAQDGALHYISSSEWVSRCVASSAMHVGVLICSSGIGVSIAANKFRGIYAARCLSVEDAELARMVNNANVLCLAARSTFELNRRILATFMTVPYQGRRIEQLERMASLAVDGGSALHVVEDTPPWQRRVG